MKIIISKEELEKMRAEKYYLMDFVKIVKNALAKSHKRYSEQSQSGWINPDYRTLWEDLDSDATNALIYLDGNLKKLEG